MSYYVGKRLDDRVKAFGLEQLQQHLVGVSTGTAQWVDGIEVTPAALEDTEQLRVLLYSMLHDCGLKRLIQVRLAEGRLSLWKKKAPKEAGVSMPQITKPPLPGETLEEDLSGAFDEDISDFG